MRGKPCNESVGVRGVWRGAWRVAWMVGGVVGGGCNVGATWVQRGKVSMVAHELVKLGLSLSTNGIVLPRAALALLPLQ